ncbi:MAG: hypothetical protein JW741_10835 [Sedimentisphaerales bacterium]|nr:hypothetical protein [Sedimentisphaerales bacterium]
MSPTEDDITAWFGAQRVLSPDRFPIGIGDDMAQIAVAEGVSVLITTDMLLDGTHFDLKTATLQQAGYKAMATSLSDCAAMATVPFAAVVAVALPPDFGGARLKELHAGIVQAGDRYDCPLVGGDITCWRSAGALAVSVAMLSKPGDCAPVRRDGARAGDVICVTGSLGGSGRGRHLDFTPRVREALAIAQAVRLHAMIDISDGLSTDLNRICRQSGVGAILDASSIPISAAAQGESDPLAAALNEGEDFELLFTLTPEQWEKLRRSWNACVPITEIGNVTAEPGMRIVMPNGSRRELKPSGYDHLGDPSRPA